MRGEERKGITVQAAVQCILFCSICIVSQISLHPPTAANCSASDHGLQHLRLWWSQIKVLAG